MVILTEFMQVIKKFLIRLKDWPNQKKIKFGVITFEPIPRAFFKKLKNYRINSIDQKISIMKKRKTRLCYYSKV